MEEPSDIIEFDAFPGTRRDLKKVLEILNDPDRSRKEKRRDLEELQQQIEARQEKIDDVLQQLRRRLTD